MPETRPDSLAAYARHRGVSKQAVSQAIKVGRLAQSVARVDGVPTIPDFAAADQEWDETSEHGEFGPAAEEKRWKAKLAELTYKQRAGELVSAAEMQAAVADALSALRSVLEDLPDKADQALPHLSLEDSNKLEEIVRELLQRGFEKLVALAGEKQAAA